MYLVAAERQGARHRPARRHAADRHLQGVHRAEGVAVPARAAPAADRRPDGVLRRADPAYKPLSRLRLSHPGGRLDGRAGARVHAGRRLRLRGARPVPRAGRGRRSRPAVLLLRRAHRLLRGDRQVPGGAPDLGPLAAGRLRRDDRARPVAALPHPDRRGVADRPAAGQQRRPHRRSRRSPPCSAAPTRCTPTPSTRCSRCPPRRPPRSRCAPSR